MANPRLTLFFVILQVCVNNCDRGDYIGCYTFKADDVLNTHTGQSVDVCLDACEQVYYKYAIIGNESTCYCGNVPGPTKVPLITCNMPCQKNETQKCGGNNVSSVYDTEVVVPGPPGSIQVLNVTETTVRINWTEPQAHMHITSYKVRANVVQTYADFTLLPLEWIVSNTTYNFELVNLQPGSIYSVSVAAKHDEDEGPNITTKAETIIGTPDPSPPEIQIVQRKGSRMVIRIPEAKNINGPVSMYRIVISIELYQQGFLIDNLGNFTYAEEQGLPYYITAELDPEDIKNDFIIGDNRTYNGYFNAPLLLTNEIDVSLGVVSEKSNVRKVRYADSTKKIILNINEPDDTSPMVVALGAAIAIGVVLLLIGVGLIIILRKRIFSVRRQRGSQSMPLSLSEPCVEIENAGFLEGEEEKVDYYGNLKRKLWNIPRNMIDVDISCVVGLGSYGKFTKGKILQQNAPTPSLIQVISDREMEKSDKKLMLKELDLLIKSSEHENVISLIGICETNTTLFVAIQDTRQTLKEMLLQSRQRDLQNNKFCLISEKNLLETCVEVAKGMAFLHSKKIMHKRLSCRNVSVDHSGVAKVSGFGLAYIRPLHETPDYTRWTAHEMLQQTRFNPKADIWSYGCLMWEVLTIGGTPYSHSTNKEVAGRVLRGMRLPQPSYVGDELFQLCLKCWQVDPDERPSFNMVIDDLAPFSEAVDSRTLSFTHYVGFDYEPHVPHYEVC